MVIIRSRKRCAEWHKFGLPRLLREGNHKPIQRFDFRIEDILFMTAEEFESIPNEEIPDGRKILYMDPKMIRHQGRQIIIGIENHAYVRITPLSSITRTGRHYYQVEHYYNFRLVHKNGN